jgi:hypothetical protein
VLEGVRRPASLDQVEVTCREPAAWTSRGGGSLSSDRNAASDCRSGPGRVRRPPRACPCGRACPPRGAAHRTASRRPRDSQPFGTTAASTLKRPLDRRPRAPTGPPRRRRRARPVLSGRPRDRRNLCNRGSFAATRRPAVVGVGDARRPAIAERQAEEMRRLRGEVVRRQLNRPSANQRSRSSWRAFRRGEPRDGANRCSVENPPRKLGLVVPEGNVATWLPPRSRSSGRVLQASLTSTVTLVPERSQAASYRLPAATADGSRPPASSRRPGRAALEPDDVAAIAAILRRVATSELERGYAPRDLVRFTDLAPAERMAELIELAIARRSDTSAHA